MQTPLHKYYKTRNSKPLFVLLTRLDHTTTLSGTDNTGKLWPWAGKMAFRKRASADVSITAPRIACLRGTLQHEHRNGSSSTLKDGEDNLKSWHEEWCIASSTHSLLRDCLALPYPYFLRGRIRIRHARLLFGAIEALKP